MSYKGLTDMATTRFDVRSPDGTPIAVWVEGTGPALVMVHGSIADHTTFDPFVAVTNASTTRDTTVVRRVTNSSVGARLLAAADAYHTMTEDRPHRPALRPSDAASQLLDEVGAGHFRRTEVDAVLEAAGQEHRRTAVALPAGLTEREVEVLRLIARGQLNKQVAATLGISPKTVGRHVEHIYAKSGVTTRAGATLFAMEHGRLTP